MKLLFPSWFGVCRELVEGGGLCRELQVLFVAGMGHCIASARAQLQLTNANASFTTVFTVACVEIKSARHFCLITNTCTSPTLSIVTFPKT